MLKLFELTFTNSTLHRIVILPFHKLFHSLCSYILVNFYKHDFFKQIIVLFVTKLHRILLISEISVGTLWLKQQRKIKEFKKKESGYLHDFAPPYYLNRVKVYSKLLLCEAPKCRVRD